MRTLTIFAALITCAWAVNIMCALRPVDEHVYPCEQLSTPPHMRDDAQHYYIDFNETTSQANFVRYISSAGAICPACARSHIRRDPYGLGWLSTRDYVNTGYERGHLVPFADLGNVTDVITNIVPMRADFNGGAWETYENYIRDVYAGQLVAKGCRYDLDTFITVRHGKRLYIPLGCYFVVFDTTTLELGGRIVDVGYVSARDGSLTRVLPYWVECAFPTASTTTAGTHTSSGCADCDMSLDTLLIIVFVAMLALVIACPEIL